QAEHEYQFRVKILNAGNESADNIDVTLAWAHYGAGQSWTILGSETLTVSPASDPSDPSTHGFEYVNFHWNSTVNGRICLLVNITSIDDIKSSNNQGQENIDVSESMYLSLAEFMIANPTPSKGYPFIELRQECKDVEIWNASIIDYSSELLDSGESISPDFLLIFPASADFDDWRTFTVEVYYHGEYVGGFQIKCTKVVPITTYQPPPDYVIIAILSGAATVVVIALAYFFMKRQQ
ncbi:MAG: hypothetical protein ACFFEF_18335, partial [Candidatus Thorarchaeota archaeon]